MYKEHAFGILTNGGSGTFTVSKAEGWKDGRSLERGLELRVSNVSNFRDLRLTDEMKRCSACGRLGRADWLIQARSPALPSLQQSRRSRTFAASGSRRLALRRGDTILSSSMHITSLTTHIQSTHHRLHCTARVLTSRQASPRDAWCMPAPSLFTDCEP
jgi:hypothetical protein